MKLIYVCSPFRDDDKLKQYANVRAAQSYCRMAYEKNCIPVAPHLYLPQFLQDEVPNERDLALRIGLRLIDYCSEVWVHGEKISEGMRGEIEYAKAINKPIVYIRNGKRESGKCFNEVFNTVDEDEFKDLIEDGITADIPGSR